MNFGKEFWILDGGMGTLLQAEGLKPGDPPERMNMEAPEKVTAIHRAYVEAGARVIYTNTFGANRLKAERAGYPAAELIAAGIRCARQAGAPLVALDIGPIGRMLEPTGTLPLEEAVGIFREQIRAGAAADLIVFETMSDLAEVRAGLLAAREEAPDKPVFVTMTFEERGRTFTGCPVSAFALTAEGLGADAVGVNCSLGPEELVPILEELSRWTTLPLIVKPNAGLPDPVTGAYDFDPARFAACMERFADMGALMLGGCCGTTPAHIRALGEILKDRLPVKRHPAIQAAVCSASRTVVIDRPRIIGERINPTGKKRFKQALLEKDVDYVLSQAIGQAEAGAEILDVNVGLPDIDEKEMMTLAVKGIQSVTDLPLQLDSTDPAVLEAALRAYTGKAIVNSVNGEEASLSRVLPLVKQYGAAVVGLTLDEGGIPRTAEGRFEIAKRILDRALALGIRREDVYIDCLTLTASAEQEGAMETLKALTRVKKELGLKTVLGVSNISFGLPNREAVNGSFLTMALYAGLDLPILNPNVPSMTAAVDAYKVLADLDKGSAEFIARYGDAAPKKPETSSPAMTLTAAVAAGLKAEAASLTRRMLETAAPMEVVNGHLIPALDQVGAEYEAGRIFLPQLIAAASAAHGAFEEIKTRLAKEPGTGVDRGTVVLATVKGDIHDIGKNIVKILLENYGYRVIDLGRDVPPEEVVRAATKHRAPLVGLSALMTTTLPSMEKTVALLRKECPWVKTVVGGAVLTPEYAAAIHADYYAKDAKDTVDIAGRVFGTK